MINDLEQLDEKWLKAIIEEAKRLGYETKPRPTLMELPSSSVAALARIALAAKSANSPVIPGVWKLVPVEPSLKMMEAAVTCEDASFDDDSDMICIHHEVIYKAMLAASPAPEDS